MTLDEAKEIIKQFRDRQGNSSDDVEAFDMVIKALEQQSCKDCISRTELLARIDAERKHLLDLKMDGAEHIIVHHARRIIEDMPSVTPQQARWIPCSEKNPNETGEYLTTIKWRDRDNVCRYMVVKRDYFAEVDTWNDSLVIAWMPLPEEYKEEEE